MGEIGQPGDMYRPRYGYEGMPGTDGILGQLMQMAAQSYGPVLAQNLGMTPLGMDQQNPYDALNRMRLTQMHDRFVAQAARNSQANYEQQLRGLASTIGLPWGPDQIAASRQLSGTLQSMEPMFAQMAPNVLDQISGLRGSPTVMAEYLFRGGMMRTDPVTGGRGMQQGSLEQLNDTLYANMFAGSNYQNMSGMTAGQAGRLFAELQLRGQMAGSFTARDLPNEILNDAARRLGVEIPRDGIDSMSQRDLEKLTSDSRVSGALRAGDTARVERTLRQHVETLSAIRDLFGDNGNPNAPIPELLGALTSLTGGLSNQVADPSRLANQLRTTANLARQSGIALPELAGMSNSAQQTAAALGLGATAAPEAVRNALAFRNAYQGLGYGANRGWDVADLQFQQEQVARLTLEATRSPAANMIGLAERLRAEMTGVFQPNSDAENYLKAVSSGVGSFQRNGATVSTNLTEDQFIKMLLDSSGGALTAGQLGAMLEQRAINREYGERVGAAGYTQRVLQPQQLRKISERAMEVPLGGSVEAQLRRAGVTVDDATRQRLIEQTRDAAADSLFGMSDAERKNADDRNAIMRNAVQAALAATPEGRQMLAAPGAQEFLTGVAMQSFGAADVQARQRIGMGLLTALSINDPRLAARAAQEEQSAAIEGRIQQQLAGLGRGTALQRFAQGLMDVDDADDRPVERLLAKTLGFTPTAEMQKKLGGEASKLRELREKFDAAQAAFMNEKDPKRRAELQAQYQASATALETSIRTLGELGEEAGLTRSAPVTQVEIGRMLRESNYLDSALKGKDTEGIAAGIAAEQASAHALVSGLLSDDTLKRLGTQAVTHADTLQTTTDRIAALARQHAGGDLGKLMSGDFKSGSDADKRAVMAELRTLRQERRAAAEWAHSNTERGGTVNDTELDAAKEARDKLNGRAGETLDNAIRTLYGRSGMTHAEIVDQVGGDAAYARLRGTDGAARRLEHISKVVDENYKLREKRTWGVWGDNAETHREKHKDIDAEFFNLRDSADKLGVEDPRRRNLQKLLDDTVASTADAAASSEMNMKVEVANLHIKRDGTSTLEMSGKSTASMARGTA